MENELRRVEYYYLDLSELVPSYKKEETTIDKMDDLFLRVVDNKLAVQFRALDTHKVLKTIIKDSKYYKKHPELKEEIENLEGLYCVDLGERIYELCVKKMIVFVNVYKTKVGVNYSEEFNSEIVRVLIRLFDIEQLRKVYSMKLIYDILEMNDGFLEDGKESIEKLNAFKNLLESNYSDNYKDFSKHFFEYVISQNPINPKEELLKLKSFKYYLCKSPELIQYLKSNYNIRIRNKDLIARVSYIDVKKETIVVEDMNLEEANKLYHSSQKYYKWQSLDKLVFKIDGEIPEVRKLKFPCKNKRKMRFYRDLECKFNVDLTGETSERISSIANDLCGYQYLSKEFIESFIKLIGVYRIKCYDDNQIAELLKIILKNRNNDLKSKINNQDMLFFINALLEKWR